MNPAYISAIAALCGSAIGALASLATSWLTQRHQDETRREAQKNIRRERIFVEFIDLASKAFADALLQTSIQDLRKSFCSTRQWENCAFFGSERTVEAAEKAMNMIVQTYYAPKFDLKTRPAIDQNLDILRDFTERCRAELR